MSADGVKKFIAAVDLVFPAPQFDGDKTRQTAWVAVLSSTIGGCSDDLLGEAAGIILRERDPKKDGRFFPTPHECTKACNAAAAAIERKRTPLLTAPPEVPYDARVRLARDLMQSPMGKQAKREGWDTTMYHFCVDNMRVPGGKEVDECKRDARKFVAIYEECLKGDHPFGGPLARLAEGMVRKARELMGTSP